jgi:hypothetical protein
MHPRSRTLRRALALMMLTILVVLVLSACGGVEKEGKVRHLPDEARLLQPGQYRTEEFEPSFSFKVGKGWKNGTPEAFDVMLLTGGGRDRLGAVNVQRVYEPSRSGRPIVSSTPKDLVRWLEHHPYLKTSDPEPVSVGGVEGKQLDVVVAKDLPEDNHSGVCSPIAEPEEECVDLFWLSTHGNAPIFVLESDKVRLIVLQNELTGQTVALGYVTQSTNFDEFAPEAQKVIDTIEWGDS